MHPRYGWLGITRRAAVREAIAVCVDAWLSDWCLQRDAIAVGVAEVEHTEWAVDEGSAQLLKSKQGSLLLAINPQAERALGSRFVAMESATPDVMAQEVADAALPDLMSRIRARAGLRSVEMETSRTPWPEALTRSEWGAMALRVTLGNVELTLAMDRIVVSGIVPEESIASVLDGRIQALQTSQVPITAVLDFGEISARDLAGLHVGEVLVSERKVGELAELRLGSARVARAAIGSIGNQLAVVAAAAHSKENP